MSDILENAKRHFEERISGQMDYVLVPEWSSNEKEPLKIYYKPMNLVDQNKIFKFVREGSLESLVETLIVRARNEDGSKMFKPVHKTEFMRQVDPRVIERICEAMATDDEKDYSGDASKNS